MDTALKLIHADSGAAEPLANAPALDAVEGRPQPATREAIADLLAMLLRDFGRVSAVLSTCAAALPAECAAGDPDIRTARVFARLSATAAGRLSQEGQPYLLCTDLRRWFAYPPIYKPGGHAEA